MTNLMNLQDPTVQEKLLGRTVRDILSPADRRGFSGWRPEDARPLLEDARAFTAGTRAEVEACRQRSAPR